MKSTLKIVGYHRSETTQNFELASRATTLQRSTLEAWAEEEGHHLIGEFSDRYNRRQKRYELPGLESAIALCREREAALVYLPIKLWRPNPFIDAEFEKFGAAGGKVIQVPHESSDRLTSFFRNRSTEIRDAVIQKKVERRIRAKQELGSLAKRVKQVEFLRHIRPLIIDLIEACDNDAEVVERLNFTGELTRTGREWSLSNYRKIRRVVADENFEATMKRELYDLIRRQQRAREIIESRNNKGAA